jgi:aerobic carbon-monoxide dehydrogenase medium subunit
LKAARFDYEAPETLEEVVALKAELGDEAKILAGGQSLVPSMNFRLARPSSLIDVNKINAAHEGQVIEDQLVISPIVRHAVFEAPQDLGPTGALLASACRHIGHVPIRTRGTFVGSLAHADPAAEWSVVALATTAQLQARSTSGDRTIAAEEFFVGPYMTALSEDEVLVEARIPMLPASTKVSFLELSRRAGDFALVCIAVVGDASGGSLQDVRIALGGVASKPIRVPLAEASLNGEVPSASLFEEAARQAAGEIDTIGDIHGSAEYRRELVDVYVRRGLERAFLPTEA